MVNFNIFDRLLGRKDVDASPRPVEAQRKEDPEILALRERNFAKNLDGYLRRPATDAERAMARAALTDRTTGNIEAIDANEMRTRFAQLDLHPDAEPENVINGVAFESRGNRQTNFERGLAKALGREITEADLAEAQEYIESDPKRKDDFEHMVGEQVTHYAGVVVGQLTANRLRNPGEGDRQFDRREASK